MVPPPPSTRWVMAKNIFATTPLFTFQLYNCNFCIFFFMKLNFLRIYFFCLTSFLVIIIYIPQIFYLQRYFNKTWFTHFWIIFFLFSGHEILRSLLLKGIVLNTIFNFINLQRRKNNADEKKIKKIKIGAILNKEMNSLIHVLDS